MASCPRTPGSSCGLAGGCTTVDPLVDYPGIYRRPLPPDCVGFSSEQGKALFAEALREGTAECYFKLAEQFTTQSEPAYCGLGTLAMVLNALELDPGRLWKGPWRWYTEDLLGCCKELDLVKKEGITLTEFRCVASCNGASVIQRRADHSTVQEFRAALQECSRVDNKFLVVSYSRPTLGQTGDGHFSPIGAYNERHDAALVMDVARFKYPPYWVSVDLLWRSLLPHDSATDRPRGYFMLSRGCCNTAIFSEFFGFSGKVLNQFISTVSSKTSSAPVRPTTSETLAAYVAIVVRSLPTSFAKSFRSFKSTAEKGSLPTEHVSSIERIIEFLQSTEIYAQLGLCQDFVNEEWVDEHAKELACLLVYASLSVVAPSKMVDTLRAADLLSAAPAEVRQETERMVGQFKVVSTACCGDIDAV